MDIIKKVKELNLPLGSYAVFGSGPLQIHGIREAQDIDLVVTTELYESLKQQGDWQEELKPNGQMVLEKDVYDIGVGWQSVGNYQPTTKRLIDTAQIIDGVPFVSLEEFLAWKKQLVGEKHQRDVKLVEAYLANHQG
jgi:hypothetical protein